MYNEVHYGTPSLSSTLILANLKAQVLIYYSSISLSSHAKLCPSAECELMRSCNDERTEQTCEWRQTSVKQSNFIYLFLSIK